MCGIVGTIGGKTTLKQATEALARLEYRGYDSFGVSVLSDDKITTKKTIGSVTEHIEKDYFSDLMEGNGVIAHTRWATHGGVTDANAHPHTSQNGEFSLVHNGVIENYAELKRKLEKTGVKFKSETDTEVIVQLLAMHFEKAKDIFKALEATLKEVSGEYAIVFMTTHDPEHLYGARQKSPLGFGVGKDIAMIASDQIAIGPITTRMTFLEDGDIIKLGKGKAEVFVQKNGKLVPTKRKDIVIPYVDQAGKGKYPHFMLKEINEVPIAAEHALLKPMRGIEEAGKAVASKQVSITGAGSAFYASMIGQYFFAKLAKTFVRTIPSDEFMSLASLTKKDHLIAVSQSGETYDTLEVVKHAKKAKAGVTAINNVLGSSMTRIADIPLFQGSGREVCVLSTKSVVSQVLILYRLAKMAAIKSKAISKKEAGVLASDEAKLVERIGIFIQQIQPEIERVARETSHVKNWFFIGRGAHYPVALESALKYKEVSYIHAEGMPAGFFKHGTISLVDANLYTVAFIPNRKSDPEQYGLTISNLAEIKARGGNIIAFGHDELIEDEIKGLYAYIPLPHINEYMDVVFELVAGQLLAYYCALALGRPIDKPRALAKAVTVR